MTNYNFKFNKNAIDYMIPFSEKLNDFLIENIDRWPPKNSTAEDIIGEYDNHYDEWDVWIHVKMRKNTVSFECPSFLLEEFKQDYIPHLQINKGLYYWFNKIALMFNKNIKSKNVSYSINLKNK